MLLRADREDALLWVVSMALYAAMAQSSRVDAESIEAQVQALVPEVERRTGRSFVAPPQAAIARTERLLSAVLTPMPVLHPEGWAPPIEAPRKETIGRARYQLEHATAIYVPGKERIYVVAESLEGVVGDLRVPPASLMGLTRCFLVHELVHALQHQYGRLGKGPSDPDAERGLEALHEGHATLVALEYCREKEGAEVAALMEASAGIDVSNSLRPDDPPATYAWSLPLVRALRDMGEGLVWAAMLEEPPAWSAVVQATEGMRVPGWVEPPAMVAALKALDPEARVVEQELAAPVGTLDEALAGTIGDGTMPRVEAGWWTGAESSEHGLRIVAFLHPNGDAAELVKLRAAAVGDSRQGIMILHPEVSGLTGAERSGSFGGVRHMEGVRASFEMRVPASPRPYREVWVANEKVSVGLVATGKGLPDKAVAAALQSVLDGLSTSAKEVLELAPLDAWLTRVKARREALPTTTSWDYRTHAVAYAISRGPVEATVCRDAFGEVLVEGAVPDPAPYAEAAFMCAVAREDFELAARARPHLTQVSGVIAAYHARGLEERRRHREALAVLELVPEDDPERNMVDHIRLGVLVSLRRWSEAAALALANPSIPPQTRAWAASEMFRAGHRTEARKILIRTCPQLEPAERAKCDDYL